MRVLLAILCVVSSACATGADRGTFARVPLLLDMYAVDYGRYCPEPCATPKRYTLLYESGAVGVLRVAGNGERTRKVTSATVAAVARVLDKSAFAAHTNEFGCVHCRHWFISVRVVGIAASFDEAVAFGEGNPEWIVEVLALLGEQPPSN